MEGGAFNEQLVSDLSHRADQIRATLPELAAIEKALDALRGRAVVDEPAPPRRNTRGRVLTAVEELPGSAATAIARSAGVTPATARVHLAALLEAGDVVKDQRGRWQRSSRAQRRSSTPRPRGR